MYFYDDAGNITEYRTYAYTLSADELHTPGEDVTPVSAVQTQYTDSEWGDRVTHYGSTAYGYDDLGNLTFDGGWTYTWEHGRQLAAMTRGDYNYTYTYNADGQRTSKTIRGVYRRFYYNGDKLIRETWGAQTVDYFYDANGEVYAMLNNGSMYYYVKNLQGDVMKMVDASGNVVASYSYDAWGKGVSASGTMAGLNSIRYRSYYYDGETGLYYLISRYYSTSLGRFISPDSVVAGADGSVQGYNLFAYCFNNPVNMSDSSGNWPKWLENTVKVVSAVVAVTAVVVMAATVSAVTAGTAAPAALLGASVFLGAALSGISGGIANEAKGNSYANGYIGGATGGAIQASLSQTPTGTVIGGGLGSATGTFITDALNYADPDSADTPESEMLENAVGSGLKAATTSLVTAYIGYTSDLAVIDGAGGLMPTYTFGFGEAVKTFFGWVDDALVYIWE